MVTNECSAKNGVERSSKFCISDYKIFSFKKVTLILLMKISKKCFSRLRWQGVALDFNISQPYFQTEESTWCQRNLELHTIEAHFKSGNFKGIIIAGITFSCL